MIWTEATRPGRERAKALLDATGPRKALKRWAAWLDEVHDAPLRTGLLEEGRARGAELPDDAVDWPAKRLIRRARGLEGAARVRSNPIMIDEAFTCLHCGADVPPHGRTARDHCPFCLRSRHVDVVPGDRAEDCGGVLDPIGLELRSGDDWRIRYTCRRCGAAKINRALTDGETPDDPRKLRALAASSAR